jgi:hypothetical protein
VEFLEAIDWISGTASAFDGSGIIHGLILAGTQRRFNHAQRFAFDTLRTPGNAVES